MSEYNLKRMDDEDKRLFDELSAFYESRERPTVDEVLGFKLAESRCFIPYLPCRTMRTHIEGGRRAPCAKTILRMLS